MDAPYTTKRRFVVTRIFVISTEQREWRNRRLPKEISRGKMLFFGRSFDFAQDDSLVGVYCD